MTDELTIEGKQFISSKRASKLSGYAQDYIGQLARGGHIEAQRIGGLWYIFMDSLMKYKDKSEAVKPEPPQKSFENAPADVLVTFEGRDYVSAGRAADLTSYHQDYIGQLARAGKIQSRQVGNRWYIDREALMAHKEEKDRLLGAVQAASVGILAPVVPKKEPETPKFEEPLMKYSTDEGLLLPKTMPKEPIPAVPDAPMAVTARDMEGIDDVDEQVDEDVENAIPIRKVAPPPQKMREPQRTKEVQIEAPRKPGKTIYYAKISGLVITAIVASFAGYIALDAFHQSRREPQSATFSAESESSNAFLASLMRIGDYIEGFVTKELIYIRKQDE